MCLLPGRTGEECLALHLKKNSIKKRMHGAPCRAKRRELRNGAVRMGHTQCASG